MIKWWVDDAMEMMAQLPLPLPLPLLQEAPHEAQADQRKEGPMMALVGWEWHAQELI